MRFDDVSLCRFRRIAFKFLKFRNDKNEVEEFVDTRAGLPGNSCPRDVAAEFVQVDSLFHERCLGALHIGIGFIYFVDGDDERNVGIFDTFERFERLRFYPVVGCDDKNGDVGDVGAACANGSERRVAGRIDKRNAFLFPVFLALYFIRGDVLRDAAGFTCDDVRVSYEIKQCGFAVIHVSHHHHNGWTLGCL